MKPRNFLNPYSPEEVDRIYELYKKHNQTELTKDYCQADCDSLYYLYLLDHKYELEEEEKRLELELQKIRRKLEHTRKKLEDFNKKFELF